jgi:hypothetical protein
VIALRSSPILIQCDPDAPSGFSPPHPIANNDQAIVAALAAQADPIVSGDNDPFSLDQYQGIAIVMPTQAVQLVGR